MKVKLKSLAKSQTAHIDREGSHDIYDEVSPQKVSKLGAFEREDYRDCVSSLNDNKEMETFRNLSTLTLAKAGRKLRNLRSNALSLNTDKPLRGPAVLGVTWDQTSDSLSVCLQAGDDGGDAAWK